MNLISFIRNNLFLQNVVASVVSFIPTVLVLTLSKYQAIKKVMYLTAFDHTYGCYMEFGVFTGSSFNFAMKVNKKIKYFGEMDCEFIGFDSFQGFGDVSSDDKHVTFNDSNFRINEDKVLKNIEKCAKGQKMRIIKGFFKDTLKDKTTKDLNIGKARIILIDCDLKEPTQLALDFIKPSLQEGTIILFDDYNYYKGNREKGEYSAFNDFKNKNPQISFRRIFDYGYAGRAFITCKVS